MQYMHDNNIEFDLAADHDIIYITPDTKLSKQDDISLLKAFIAIEVHVDGFDIEEGNLDDAEFEYIHYYIYT